MATLLSVLVAVGAILLALFVLPAPWGAVLVGGVIVWEIAEKLFWLRYSKRIPVAVGPEALIGLPVTAISACQPEGRVKLHGERWKARCRTGAELGETLVIEDIDRITLIVSNPGSSLRT